MSILVTGGAGYIGSHTVYELISNGYDVIVVDNLSTGFFEAIHPKAHFYNIDLHNKRDLCALFKEERIDCVIHFAAFSQVGESMQNPLKYYYNNVGGTVTLLDCMHKHHINNIIFSSTAATYGIPQHMPLTELDDTRPINPYGETKLAIEQLLYWAERAYGIHYVALRYFNACGAHPNGLIGEAHDPESHLIPIVLQVPNGLRRNISIFGDNYPTKDGSCIRDYVHVCDLAQAHILAMKYLQNTQNSNIFNLGNGLGYSVKEVISVSSKVTHFDIPIEIAPRRLGDPAVLVASAEKAEKVLGWRPQYTTLEDIIVTAWNWHNKHPYGYKTSP